MVSLHPHEEKMKLGLALMDHRTAVETHTPERYVLGELLPLEREEFEEHMADCSVCMNEVAAADVFAANATAVFEEEAAAKTRATGWLDLFRPRAWGALAFSGALNLALLAFVGYGLLHTSQRVELRPDVSETFVVRPPARGIEQVLTVRAGSRFVTLQFDLAHRYQKYSYSLEGNTSQLEVPPDAETLNLTVPTAGLAPGDHSLRVEGMDSQRTDDLGRCVLRISPAK